MYKPTIVFDFDGVIHKYSRGWQNGLIYDPPVDGIKELIDTLRFTFNYNVVIVSTRCTSQQGINDIRSWLFRYNISVDDICANKPPAKVYIDDRAICFDGDCSSLLNKINNFKSWQEM